MRLNSPLGRVVPAFLLITSVMSSTLQAGVVVNGTRIIFENNQTEKAIQLDNRDKHPNLVQLWTDQGNSDSTLETANGPFLMNPQIFKMNAQQSQIIRLQFIGQAQALASDKESLFYLNVNEIPALKAQDLEANRLVVSFTNRIKILYRPKGLQGTSAETPNKIRYQVLGNQLRLNNPTAYHANIAQLQIMQNGKILSTEKSLIVPPYAQLDIPKPKQMNNNIEIQLKANFINDFGAVVSTELNAE